MPRSIFIETTIPSYYVARPSRDLIQLARQELTREWWDIRRYEFALRTSQLVLDEAASGEAAKAAERMTLLDGIPLLDLNEEVEGLATKLVTDGILPAVAGRDAYHLAAAGVHHTNFLLTWNCKHIANPFMGVIKCGAEASRKRRGKKQRQRRFDVQPRVARHELPWDRKQNDPNPNGVVAGAAEGHNPGGVDAFIDRFPG